MRTSSEGRRRVVRLALSGGGYRAMLFHVGALWKLNDIGELERLGHVSSVSGGSITAGVLARSWRTLRFESGVASNFEGQIADPLMRLASRTIDVPAVLSGLLPGYATARGLEKLYRKHLFGDSTLGDLPEHPAFAFNATNLQTGAVWTFERDGMGDPSIGRVPAQHTRLATAVAASSAFPPFLSPLVLRLEGGAWEKPLGKSLRAYDDLSVSAAALSDGALARFRKRVVLVDGGVADNLGSVTAWGGPGDVYISDGGGVLDPEARPPRNWLGQLIRILAVIYDQPSQLRSNRAKAEMADRDEGRAGRRSRLEGDGAIWNMRWPPEDHVESGKLFDASVVAVDWASLASLPTRLKAMAPDLQKRLVNWGYIACNRSLPYVARLFEVPGAFSEDRLPFPEARSRRPATAAATR